MIPAPLLIWLALTVVSFFGFAYPKEAIEILMIIARVLGTGFCLFATAMFFLAGLHGLFLVRTLWGKWNL